MQEKISGKAVQGCHFLILLIKLCEMVAMNLETNQRISVNSSSCAVVWHGGEEVGIQCLPQLRGLPGSASLFWVTITPPGCVQAARTDPDWDLSLSSHPARGG